MYLARVIKRINNRGRTHYILRESYPLGSTFSFRDLFDLGADPSQFIVYPGGNAFYLDGIIEEKLNSAGIQPDGDSLEDLFWPFLRPDIKRAIGHFRDRSRTIRKKGPLTNEEEKTIHQSVPSFDKRRLHYLRIGTMDQGPVVHMPPTLFKDLVGKSRDEIEQLFLEKERALKPSELKSYVFTAFNIHQYFQNFLAKKMPHALDQKQVDSHFIEEICRINRSLFQDGRSETSPSLHEYLVRYVIMFFDHDYENSTLLDEFAQDFIYRTRHRPTPNVPPITNPVNLEKACTIFDLKIDKLHSFTRSRLARRYRRLAQRLHPDKGGSSDDFVALNDAYQRLLLNVASVHPYKSKVMDGH